MVAKSMTKGTSYLSEKVESISPVRRALVLALLVVFSALLGTYASPNFGILLVNGTPILPGIYFGLVLSIGVFCWTTRRKSELFTVLVITTVAWILAFQTAFHIHELIHGELGRIQKQVALDGGSLVTGPLQVNYVFALCGAFGGLVGSFVTGAGISFVSKEFYARGNWARTILVGMVTGTFLEFLQSPVTSPTGLPIHVGSALPLLLVWQTSVAASIGYGLHARQDPD
jgi:hypothetical protein